MKTRRFIATMLMLAMVFTLACIPVTAAEPQTLTAGTTEELKTALSNAANGDTVKITADIFTEEAENGSFVIKDKTITLDLNGKKLQDAYCENAHVTLVLDNATCDVVGNGFIYNYNSIASVLLKNNAVLNVKGATIQNANSENALLFESGTCNLYDGILEGNCICSILSSYDVNCKNSGGTINIYGGYALIPDSSEYNAFKDNVTLNIDAGIFNQQPPEECIVSERIVTEVTNDSVIGTSKTGYKVSKKEFFLDLDETDETLPSSKTLDQNYSATVTETKTHATKVQVSWNIETISATITDNKIWDAENLKWIADTNNENTVTCDAVSAEFNFVNLSSLKINAKVEFKAETGISATPTYKDNAETTEGDGEIMLDTANTTASTYDNTGKVVVTVPADTDYFKKLTDSVTGGKYGTYTVTISKGVAKIFDFDGFFDAEKGNAKINGMKASEICQYMVDYGMIADASKFGDVVVNSTYYSKIAKGEVPIARKLSVLFDTTHMEFVEGQNVWDTLVGDNDYVCDKVLTNVFNCDFTWDGTAFNKIPQ